MNFDFDTDAVMDYAFGKQRMHLGFFLFLIQTASEISIQFQKLVLSLIESTPQLL